MFPSAQLGLQTRSSPKLTLVLDLDETLVHSTIMPNGPYDQELTLLGFENPIKVFWIEIILAGFRKFKAFCA